MKSIKIGICGLGTVGAGTFDVLARNSQQISARTGCQIEVSLVGARRENPNCALGDIKRVEDIFAVCADSDVDIVVELIGGTTVAKDLVLAAVAAGKHVVTANKALIAEHGNEIFAAAAQNNVAVAYEAAVAGGIPIIKALREGLAANQISWLAGIINGTGNFILTEMRDKGRDFNDVLAEAQELGYAEADPTFDIDGTDAAHKLTILASLAFGIPLDFASAYTQGIDSICLEDVTFAEELGYTIKHLGVARKQAGGIELRVHPTLIPKDQLIAKVDGVMNAVMVQGDAVGPSLYYGPGAGAEPTASAVVADIIDIARSIKQGVVPAVPALAFEPLALSQENIVSPEQFQCAYYLRISVQTHPGVMAKVTGILSEEGINIESLLQKEADKAHKNNADFVPVIILTHQVQEAHINRAIAAIEALSDVDGSVIRIRVETLSA